MTVLVASVGAPLSVTCLTERARFMSNQTVWPWISVALVFMDGHAPISQMHVHRRRTAGGEKRAPTSKHNQSACSALLLRLQVHRVTGAQGANAVTEAVISASDRLQWEIRKSSLLSFVPFISSLIHFGSTPRPDHVTLGSFLLRYRGTIRNFGALLIDPSPPFATLAFGFPVMR